MPDPTLTGNNLNLWVANATLTVTTTTSTTTTTTGSPGTGSGSTTTTVPGNVYTNTQPEPWNPVPCTLGVGLECLDDDYLDGNKVDGNKVDDEEVELTDSRLAGVSRSASGRLAPLPDDAPTFPLCGPTPHTLTLAVSQGVLEASLTDRAFGANSLGFGRIGLVL